MGGNLQEMEEWATIGLKRKPNKTMRIGGTSSSSSRRSSSSRALVFGLSVLNFDVQSHVLHTTADAAGIGIAAVCRGCLLVKGCPLVWSCSGGCKMRAGVSLLPLFLCFGVWVLFLLGSLLKRGSLSLRCSSHTAARRGCRLCGTVNSSATRRVASDFVARTPAAASVVQRRACLSHRLCRRPRHRFTWSPLSNSIEPRQDLWDKAARQTARQNRPDVRRTDTKQK